MSVKKGDGRGERVFLDMLRATRIMPRLQLSAEDLARVSIQPWTDSAPPELIFYTGCNILRTPHIPLFYHDFLDALDLSYAVYDGPSKCCGILQLRLGDTENAGLQAYGKIQRFAETGASKVVSWCPTCMIQIGATALPV
tara:strand:+ start:112 stop:531 length:420 start_codon:yes stop_codon:yes gene_type:complete